MNKFLITLIVPTIGKEYNLYVPNNKKMGTIKKYILESLYELSENNFTGDINNTLFIDRDNGEVYENDILIKDSGIKNGDKIIIVKN